MSTESKTDNKMSKFSTYYDALMLTEDVNAARDCNTDEWRYDLKSKEDGKLEIGIRLKEEPYEVREDKNRRIDRVHC